MKIYAQMVKIMADIEPVAKARRNVQQNYQFRGVDDVYQAVQAIMAKHGVISLPTVLEDRTEERTTKGGSALIYRILKIRYDFYAEDGSTVPATVIGEGMDSGDKASNKAMSVADKYCLLQAFKIPTEDPKDPENDSHAVAPPPRVDTTKPIRNEEDFYDHTHATDRERLIEELRRRNIEPGPERATWKLIAGTLHGKSRGELDAIIAWANQQGALAHESQLHFEKQKQESPFNG